MNPIRYLVTAALMGLVLVPNLAHADDIDLYTGAGAGGTPNVLIVLDNNSNWSATMDSSPPADADSVAGCGGATGSYYCAQKYALIKLLQQKDATTGNYFIADSVGVGIMMYGSGSQQGRLHPVRGAEDDRRQPGGADQTPEGPGHQQRQGQQQPGLRLDDVGGVQVLRRRQWQPVVVDDLGPDSDQRCGHGYRHA